MFINKQKYSNIKLSLYLALHNLPSQLADILFKLLWLVKSVILVPEVTKYTKLLYI